MTAKKVIEHLKELIRKEGTSRKLAKRLKISEAYLSDILLGRTDPGPKILKPLGLKRQVTYVRIK